MLDREFLTWIGGAFPDDADAPLRAGENIHEMTPTVDHVCRCGVRHAEPPPSRILVRVRASGDLAVWIADRAGRMRRVLDGQHDPSALALHLRSLRLEESTHDDPLLASLVGANAVRFFAVDGASSEEVVGRLGTWLAAEPSVIAAHACFVGDHLLRAVADLGDRIACDNAVALTFVCGPRVLRASVFAAVSG